MALDGLKDQIRGDLVSLKGEYRGRLDALQSMANAYTSYGGLGEIPKPTEVTLASVDSLVDSINRISFTRPAEPAGLTTQQPEKYRTHIWSAWQADSLENKLMDIVSISDTGILKELSGVNIGEDFQEALYNYQRTNDIRDLEYELDVLDGKWAADGYTLPPDALVHNRAWLVARFDEKRTDRTRNIFSELAKIAQQNVQWAYENGIKMEQMHSSFAIEYSKIYKDIVDAIIAIWKGRVDVALAELEANLKKLQAEVDIKKLQVSRDEAQAKLELERALGLYHDYVNAYNAAISANTTVAGQRLTASSNVASGYGDIMKSFASMYSGIDISNIKA